MHATGITSRSMRVSLLCIWALGTVLASLSPVGISPEARVAMTLWLGVALVFVSYPQPFLPWWRALINAATASVAAVLTLLPLTSVPTTQQWLWQMAGNVLGLLAARGAVAWTSAGAAGQGALVTYWLVTLDTPVTVAGVSLIAVAFGPFIVGAIWWLLIRRNVSAQLRSDQLAERSRMDADNSRMAIARGRTVMNLATHAAQPVLDRLAAGETGPGIQHDSALAEATVRDLIRAPRLAAPPLDAACREARERGVDVVLMDDGDDQQPLPDHLREEACDLVGQALPRGDSHIQIRVLPPGRAVLATFLSEGAAESPPLRHRWPTSAT